MSQYTVESGSSSSGVTSKRPYDAMVYKDADSGYTIAVDGSGNIIKKVLSSLNTDDVVIQAAIDSLSAGSVFICSGTYLLSSNITVSSNIHFYGSGPSQTLFYSNSSSNRHIRSYDSSNVVFSDFSIVDYVTLSCFSSLLDVENVEMRNVYATGPCSTIRFYIYNASVSSTIKNVTLDNCIAESTGWGFAIHSDVVDKPIENITFSNCKAIDCGKYSSSRYCIYDVGFSLESAATYNVTFINCLAQGCLESGFHQEYAPIRENVKYIGCVSKDNGQKTKLSNTIVDREDITKSTPFVCTNIGTTHAEVNKIRVRIVSELDTITNFSVRIQGLTAGDVPIDETITEATPGVVHEVNGWSFYTTNTFKTMYNSVVTTVQSVTGASPGDVISVGQDGTYASGFLATKCTLIGCETNDEIYSIRGAGSVRAIGCKDSDSVNSTYNAGYFRSVGFIEKWASSVLTNNVNITVGDGYDYPNLTTALSYILDSSDTKRYTIVLMSNISETSAITWKSYVNLIGNGKKITITDNTNFYSMLFNNCAGVIFKDVYVDRLGIRTGSIYGGLLTGSTNSSTVLENVTFSVVSTTPTGSSCGIRVEGEAAPVLRNCIGRAGGTVMGAGIYLDTSGNVSLRGCVGYGNSGSTSSSGISVNNSANPLCSSEIILDNCTGYGGSGGSECYGILVANLYNKIILRNCIGYGGSTGNSCHGFYSTGSGHCYISGCTFFGGNGNSSIGCILTTANSANITDCVFVSGLGTGAFGCSVQGNSSLTMVGCISKYPELSLLHLFTGSNNTITPSVSGNPYFISSIRVSVTTAGGGGSTLNIGTTPGGNEIASGIPTDSIGSKYFTFNRQPVVGGNPIYLTFSDTNTRASIFATVGYNNVNGYGLHIDTSGYSRISNCVFQSNQASSAGYITTTARTAGKFLIENCSFESVGTYDLAGQSSGVVPVYNCTFARGSLSNITLPGQGTAATITAGDTYVDVTHSLASTPTKVRVTPTTNLGARSFWVDTKGATTFRININSTDVIDHTFDWEAEV